MSKKLICLVSFVLVLGLTSNAFAQPADGQIQQTLVAPVIDGLEEDIWWGVLAYPIDQVVVGSATSIQNELDFSATWKALWDSTRIYFLVDVTDDILIFDSPGGGAWPDMHYDDSVQFQACIWVYTLGYHQGTKCRCLRPEDYPCCPHRCTSS